MPLPGHWAVLVLFWLGLLGLLSWAPGKAVGAKPADECVACHTDPAQLKALAQEPPLSEEEGEG